jgi:hypothetical protein
MAGSNPFSSPALQPSHIGVLARDFFVAYTPRHTNCSNTNCRYTRPGEFVGFIKNLFGGPSAPALPPLQDPVLGTLKWDEDSEGWVAELPAGPKPASLYIGAGSVNEYPEKPLLALVREPFQRYEELCERALTYLKENAKLSVWSVRPEEFKPVGIQTYEHYLADRTYSLTFTDPGGAIWKVDFRGQYSLPCILTAEKRARTIVNVSRNTPILSQPERQQHAVSEEPDTQRVGRHA